MADIQHLTRDITSLRGRVLDSGEVLDQENGSPTTAAAAIALPTLAERRLTDEVQRVARRLADGRDHEGGWDEPWTTVLALEGFVALKLRGVDFKGLDDIIRFAVQVLRQQGTMPVAEREMRLGRAIVLAGLALQNASLIDDGLMRVRSVMDKGLKWQNDREEMLHGLMALVDLVAVTRDEATREIVEAQLAATGLVGENAWADEEGPGILSRAGTVLDKLGRGDDARSLYLRAVQHGHPGELGTDLLKYRIELGARLVGDEEMTLRSSSEEESNENSASGTGDAEGPAPAKTRPTVTALVVQEKSSDNVARTLSALLAQNDPPEEIVVAWIGNGHDAVLPDFEGRLVQLQTPLADGPQRSWTLAVRAAEEEWIWPIRAGQTLPLDALKLLREGAVNGLDAVHLSSRNGELQENIDRLSLAPTLRPGRVLARSEALQKVRITPGAGTASHWDLMHKALGRAGWCEAVHSDVKQSQPDFEAQLELIEAMGFFYPNHPDEAGSKERSEQWDRARSVLYELAQEDAVPVASVVIRGAEQAEEFQSTLQSVLENTSTVPFELIVLFEGEADDSQRRSLEELGALLISGGEKAGAESLDTMAAEKAHGHYMILLNAGEVVEPGWMESLVHGIMESPAAMRQYEEIEVALTSLAKSGTEARKRPESASKDELRTKVQEEAKMDSNSSTGHANGGVPDVTGDGVKDTRSLAELLTRAETLIKDGRFDIAEEALEKGRHQVNGNVRSRVMYWTLLGDARFRMDRPDEAYQCYQKAVDDDPSAERAWLGIGTFHLVKGDLDKAEDIFSRITDLNPGNLRGHLGRGNVLLRRGDSKQALPHFMEAARIDPGYRPTIVGLVAAAVQSEQTSDVPDVLDHYLERHPEDAEARFHLAAILFGRGENARAREEAELVLKANPSHKGARELLNHLPQASGGV